MVEFRVISCTHGVVPVLDLFEGLQMNYDFLMQNQEIFVSGSMVQLKKISFHQNERHPTNRKLGYFTIIT